MLGGERLLVRVEGLTAVDTDDGAQDLGGAGGGAQGEEELEGGAHFERETDVGGVYQDSEGKRGEIVEAVPGVLRTLSLFIPFITLLPGVLSGMHERLLRLVCLLPQGYYPLMQRHPCLHSALHPFQAPHFECHPFWANGMRNALHATRLPEPGHLVFNDKSRHWGPLVKR